MYKTHEMRMVRIEDSGFEEWACPTCGRRMLLRWPPYYEKHVMEPGDEEACHICSDADDTLPGLPPAPADETADTGDTPGTGTPPSSTAPRTAPSSTNTACGAGRRWLRETGTHAAFPHAGPP